MIKKYGNSYITLKAGFSSTFNESATFSVLYDFPSINDFVDYITNAPLQVRDPHSTWKSDSRTRFTGTKSLEEALELMSKGWTEGAEKIEKGLKEVLKNNSTSVSTRQRSVYDVIGGNASVPRYLQGVPTNMIRQVRQPVKEKIVDINIDVCFSGGTSKEEMINNCINQLQRVVNLENSGVRTNVYVCRMGAEDDIAELVRICVKKSTERLNVLKVAFPCAHPSMLRRLLFACDERSSELPKGWCGAYGKVVRTENKINGRNNIDVFLENTTSLINPNTKEAV